MIQEHGICKPGTIFASNTSTLSITEIAAGSGRDERFVGMHFCLPAQLMKLVEMSPGLNTTEEAFAQAWAFCKALGQTPVKTKDNPGFILNYFLIPFNNDAIRLVEAGVAEAAEIDKAIKGAPADFARLPVDAPVSGARALEIIAEFEAGTAAELGLKVRTGAQEETVIGIDPRAGQLFVDRTRSGQVGFHAEFSGRHTAPLPLKDGRVRLHVFVDWSSVEVFAESGEVVVVRPGGVTVEDLDSTNGTYVNHDRVDSVALRSGMEVQIGKFRLTFYAGTQRLSA